jgi:transcriptional regulator CtsR
MKGDDHKNFSNQYSPRFGEIAVNMGFITKKQLTETYVEQIEDDFSNKPHRFIGDILFENRLMTNKEMYIVLTELIKEDSL